MKLCITEKPSVARDIANILGANVKRDGYYEGGDYKITWTYGHLCTLKEPADYSRLWKRWSLWALPMIPERFGIKVIPQESIERQFKVIESLIRDADVVINCGDAGQEGELIQRWVMQKAKIKCPVQRLWISSLTDESIRNGFNNLRPQSDFDSLYFAGLSRAIGDWVLGMNATRLFSLKYSSPGNILSVGRVQTPTLALIVRRQREIENFVPETYFELKTKYRDVVFSAQNGRFDNLEKAQSLSDKLASSPFVITDISEKQGREAPPRLFDLTSLQVECNKKWGWSADDTLKLIQSLYEKKVTTYPRVDTTYLSTDIYTKIPEIMSKMTPYANLTADVLAKPITKSKKIFDNAKVTDHHAIIPTGELPSHLVGNERLLYHLIALRFIAAFYPDCIFMQTTVLGNADDVIFKTSGKVITSRGWRDVLDPEKEKKSDPIDKEAEDEENENNMLPNFEKGESGPHAPFIASKTTQPPKYYTEGSLLRAMEMAGKNVQDETLREAMKENGIGRPSTRSAIIETLFKRKYIYRQRKNIIASTAGIQLIDTINHELLKSAELTGIWENKLRRIERQEYSAEEFIDELKTLIKNIVETILQDNDSQKIIVDNGNSSSGQSSPSDKTKSKSTKSKSKRSAPIRSLSQIKCPQCGKGTLIKGRTAYGCSLYASGCAFRLSFDSYPANLTPAQLNKKLKTKGQ